MHNSLLHSVTSCSDIMLCKYTEKICTVLYNAKNKCVLDFLFFFQVKKGEMLFGFQPYAMHDGKVFESPDTYLPRRFMGEEGEKLIPHVFWSNGRESDDPTVKDKQCAGKNLVVTMSRAFVAEMFLRYKEFTLEVEGTGVQTALFFSSLTKA